MNKQQSINLIIDIIKKSDNIKQLSKTSRIISKTKLISRIKKFELKDFCCYDIDGYTLLEPDVYFSKLSKKKAKEQFESKDHQMLFHTSIGDLSVPTSKKFKNAEYGTNLLRCCPRCVDLWLENLFKLNYLKENLEDKKLHEFTDEKFLHYKTTRKLLPHD